MQYMDDPRRMTSEDRLREIASIFAKAFLHLKKRGSYMQDSSIKTPEPSTEIQDPC